MPKLKIFPWQLCHASLPTKATLSKKCMNIDSLCPFCQSEIEDQNHLFLHCPISQEYWTLAVAHNWINSNFISSQYYSILQRLLSPINATFATKIERVLSLLLSIWNTRNNIVFSNETSIPGSILIRAKKATAEGCIRHKLTQPFHPPNPN